MDVVNNGSSEPSFGNTDSPTSENEVALGTPHAFNEPPLMEAFPFNVVTAIHHHHPEIDGDVRIMADFPVGATEVAYTEIGAVRSPGYVSDTPYRPTLARPNDIGKMA